jgi:sulfur carrier protein ThiS
MKVHVRCLANLADAETCTYEGSTAYEFDSGVTVTDLMHHIRITPESVKLILLNGKHAEADTVLSDGDRVALAPATGGM